MTLAADLGFDPATSTTPTSSRASRERRSTTRSRCYNEGKPEEGRGLADIYGGGPVEFYGMLGKWRDDGELRGLELR
jgi:hypothetical protein